ncbi:hypothetical protein ALP68_200318 [Pseudomonas ficuserectae]|nr:hypothetical protein ALO69_200013 [Pseudomonas ficuserectae]RMS31752.1 hypothetical protein ALP68_200318 [Pseudomonas ficuserectae]RMS35867.1 O-methyl transferase protein [Pseudomonas ficuserectae]
MALMFSRLAKNFAKNGYYPTDEATLERALSALVCAPHGAMRILDPCAGEGAALAEAAHVLGREVTASFAVEYDADRAAHARSLLDHVLHSDLMDTMISRQSFGLLWLNPPYGDLVADHSGASQYQGKGRQRLEKAFYQRSLPLLQYGGVLVFIVPGYVLDDELCGWLSNNFTSLQIFSAVDRQFKQVVIFGIRTRRIDADRQGSSASFRRELRAVGAGEMVPTTLPEDWVGEKYTVPPVASDLEHFYRLSLEPAQFALEIARLQGLWADFNLHFGRHSQKPRPPATALSRWHLALALAAGAISGVVTSRTGRVLVLKGDTYKEKSRKTEFTEDENGEISEVRTLTDRFIPVIRAWDMTPGSLTLGEVLTITSSPAVRAEVPALSDGCVEQPTGGSGSFQLGKVVCSAGVHDLVTSGGLDPMPYIRRHASGDWGDLAEEDRKANMDALQHGNRLLSWSGWR